MNINLIKDANALARQASQLIIDTIKTNPSLLLCAATGNSPTETYRQLVAQKSGFDVSQLRVLKLDEWGGVPMDHPQTCEQYLQQHLIQPLGIDKNRYWGFHSNAKKPSNEVSRIQETITANGPITICILGLGLNGHIAFNEPADWLQPHCHVASLTKQSMQHSMASKMQLKPTYGLTLGMADILQSEMIIMLISGEHKKAICKEFLSGKISAQLPASFLWLHPNVHCFIEE